MQHTNLEIAIILGCILIAACYEIRYNILSKRYHHYDYNKHPIGLPTLITIIVLTVGGLSFIGWYTFIR